MAFAFPFGNELEKTLQMIRSGQWKEITLLFYFILFYVILFFAKKDKNSETDKQPRQETTGQPTSLGQKDWGQTHLQPSLHCYLLCHTTSNQSHLPSIITKGSSETMNKVNCLYHFYFWELYNLRYYFSQEVLNATVKCYVLIYRF